MVSLGVLTVRGNLFRRVGRVVHLKAIDRNLLTQFIEQLGVIAGILLTAPGMGNQADSTAVMRRLDHLRDITVLQGETGFKNQTDCGSFAFAVAMLLEESYQRMGLLCTRLLEQRLTFIYGRGDAQPGK